MLLTSSIIAEQGPLPGSNPGGRAAALIEEALAERSRGELEAAVGSLREAIALDEADRRAWLLLAETTAWLGDLDAAEALYRSFPEPLSKTHEARLGLARVLLWKGEPVRALPLLRELDDESHTDLDVLELLARAHYWSGDFRTAERRYGELLARDPERESARVELNELRAGARPGVSLEAGFRSDDQPYEIASQQLALFGFFDPLTRVELRARRTELRDRARRELVPEVSIGVDAKFPSTRTTFEGTVGLARFPNGVTEPVGKLAVGYDLARAGSVSLGLQRSGLFYDAASIDTASRIDTMSLAWSRTESTGATWALAASTFRYFDRNRGHGVDGFLLLPVVEKGPVRIEGGLSAAWRDTEENRFTVVSIDSVPMSGGTYRYLYQGEYDPYWTPLDLREARGVATVRYTGERVGWTLHGTAGVAQEMVLAFGPESGTAPAPGETYSFLIDRESSPWSLDFSFSVRLGSRGMLLHLGASRHSTASYESEEYVATLVRRF